MIGALAGRVFGCIVVEDVLEDVSVIHGLLSFCALCEHGCDVDFQRVFADLSASHDRMFMKYRVADTSIIVSECVHGCVNNPLNF